MPRGLLGNSFFPENESPALLVGKRGKYPAPAGGSLCGDITHCCLFMGGRTGFEKGSSIIESRISLAGGAVSANNAARMAENNPGVPGDRG